MCELRGPRHENVLHDDVVETFEQPERAGSVRLGLRRILADDVERPKRPVLDRLEHFRQVPATFGRKAPAVFALELRAARSIFDVLTSDVLVRNRSHVAAALHVVLAAQRHETGSIAADMSGQQREVDDREHVVGGVMVFGDAERPADLRRLRARVRVCDFTNGLSGDACDLRRVVERIRRSCRDRRR